MELAVGKQKASLTSLFLGLCTLRHLEDSLAWSPSLLLHVVRHIEGPLPRILLCRSVYQTHKGIT